MPDRKESPGIFPGLFLSEDTLLNVFAVNAGFCNRIAMITVSQTDNIAVDTNEKVIYIVA